MRLYLDCCCYNRPYDDLSQNRIHDESDAILSILHRSRTDETVIVGSTVLQMEIDEITDTRKKLKVQSLLKSVGESAMFTLDIQARATQIQSASAIHTMDALHLASAEAVHADVFLTTDDKLLRACKNLSLSVRVVNPVSYLAEVIEHDGHQCE